MCPGPPNRPAAPACPASPAAHELPSHGERHCRERGVRLDELLRDLGASVGAASRLEHLGRPAHAEGGGFESGGAGASSLCPTGLHEIDRLLGGGLPRGRLCEVSGPASSGLTSLALSLLATTTRAGHCAGVVDRADAFDPGSAERAGVVLERVLWVRPRDFDSTRRCAERLLETDGFPLVLIDLARASCTKTEDAALRRRARSVRTGVRSQTPGSDDTQTWLRLSRLASGTRSALVLISNERRSGGFAHIALEMRPARAHFSATPVLLEEIEVEVTLTRHRAAPIGSRAALRLGTSGTRAA